MGTVEESQEQTSFVSNNQQYNMNTPFMMMRLNTDSLVEDIKNFLSSKERKLTWVDGGEMPKEEVVQIGLPLANDEGIMRICNVVRMRVNHHVVQGNFKEDHYWDYIGRQRKELSETVIKKCYDWDIDDSNLNMIIDEICSLVEAFLTRPVSDGERKSFSNQIQARESVVQQIPKSSWGQFAGGIGRQ